MGHYRVEVTVNGLFQRLHTLCLFPRTCGRMINDEGQLAYAILKDGELIFAPEYNTETESFSIPEKKHFPFTIPRAAEVMRYFVQEDKELYDDLFTYLKRFSALDEEQWAIVVHYVFLTYLHDHAGIDYCPYILFHAVPERGKSRTGKSVTHVAFRGIHLVELREATIFRYSENLHGTLFFDLMDISKKAERAGCGDILLLRYEKGAKCPRVQYPERGPFNDTVYYDIYGPAIIASNEPLHKILETRCLPIIMPNRPGNYENPRPELGQEMKERLTAWRAKHLFTQFPDIEPIEGISGRLWDIHDKKCQEENGDFPRPARMPPVVKLKPFFSVQSFYSFQWINLMIRRPDIHLRYSVKNTPGNSGNPANKIFVNCHMVMSAPRMGYSI